MSIMRFKRDERNRLDELDALVVDEVSMLDLQLAKASQLYQRVAGYLVGDPDQLPSIGTGSILRDFIVREIARGSPRNHHEANAN